MRAVQFQEYGPPEVLTLTERPLPRPKKNEVLVRVRAVAVTSGDARIRGARFPRWFSWPARLVFGVRRPRLQVLGSCLSGVVESVGDQVSAWRPGDEVVGMNGAALGAYAEFVCVRAERLVRKPPSVSFTEAAAVLFGGTTALHFLRELGGLESGHKLCVVGASGAVGTAALQLARLMGASVTAVCSARNAEFVRQLGADLIVDYTSASLGERPERYDRILDTVGALTVSEGVQLLRPGGLLLLPAADLRQMLFGGKQTRAGTAPERPADFEELLRLLEEGKLLAPIEQVFPLEGVVEAHRRVDSGRKVGNLILTP